MDLPLKTDKSCNCSDSTSNTGDHEHLRRKNLDDCKTSGITVTHFGKDQTSDQNNQIFAATSFTPVFNIYH